MNASLSRTAGHRGLTRGGVPLHECSTGFLPSPSPGSGALRPRGPQALQLDPRTGTGFLRLSPRGPELRKGSICSAALPLDRLCWGQVRADIKPSLALPRCAAAGSCTSRSGGGYPQVSQQAPQPPCLPNQLKACFFCLQWNRDEDK